jgi:hypothetical protein
VFVAELAEVLAKRGENGALGNPRARVALPADDIADLQHDNVVIANF